MRIAVWIITGLLALFFLFVGASKAFASWEFLQAGSMGIPVILLKIAGFAEIVGAVGLIVPAATRVLPILTPIAAIGLVGTMLGATVINIGLGMPAVAVQTGLAGLLSALVAWARLAGPAKITPRSAATPS
ncbi:DoxX family protein [Microlunatus sp. GCM10028923]|uniref:DoxX family protein n=1 Tax=Microlunatus sp. GCM10028923 TaxID=3273400 RepID=UPI00360A7599